MMPITVVPFGRTGVKVSRLWLGTANFGGRTPAAEAVRIIDRALDAGINVLDTANVYGSRDSQPDGPGGPGASEQVIGQALQGRRERVFLATKVRWPMGDGPNDAGNSRLHVLRQADESLRRLRTDYLDLYQLHGPDSDTPIEETLGALTDLVRAGKVRYVGASNFAAWQLCEALWASDRHHMARFASDQPQYNLLDRRIEQELAPFCQKHQLALATYSPTAGGLLSAGYRPGRPPPEGSRKAAGWWMPNAHRYEAQLAAAEKLWHLAKEFGLPLHQMALAWVLQQPCVTSAIVGPRTLEHLEEYLAGADLDLPAELPGRLDAVVPPGSLV